MRIFFDFRARLSSIHDSFFLDTTTPMSLSNVRGTLVKTPGAKKSSPLLTSTRSTGTSVSGPAVKLVVTKKVKLGNVQLTII